MNKFEEGLCTGMMFNGKVPEKEILPFKQLTVYGDTTYSAVDEGWDGVANVGIRVLNNILDSDEITVSEKTIYDAKSRGYSGVERLIINVDAEPQVIDIPIVGIAEMPVFDELDLGNGYKLQVKFGFINPFYCFHHVNYDSPPKYFHELHYNLLSVICKNDIPIFAKDNGIGWTYMHFAGYEGDSDYTIYYEPISLTRDSKSIFTLKFKQSNQNGEFIERSIAINFFFKGNEANAFYSGLTPDKIGEFNKMFEDFYEKVIYNYNG